MPDNLFGLAQCINRALELCNQPKEGINIEVESEIPVGRGLGSSAAAATAIVRGIFEFFERPLSVEELYSLVETADNLRMENPAVLI